MRRSWLSQSTSIKLSGRGHERSGEQSEHSLEVQLPFLQRTLGQFELVPIIMGDQSYEASRALGVALAKLIGDSDTLIVASSDLSHYHPYDEASTIDHNTLHAIEAWDYFDLSRNLQSRVWEACGGGPIVAAMMAAERLGANRAELLKYANSGDVTGDRSRVVGYSAFALYKSAPTNSAAPPFSLTPKEKQELLSVARKSAETAVRERKTVQAGSRIADTSAGPRRLRHHQQEWRTPRLHWIRFPDGAADRHGARRCGACGLARSPFPSGYCGGTWESCNTRSLSCLHSGACSMLRRYRSASTAFS